MSEAVRWREERPSRVTFTRRPCVRASCCRVQCVFCAVRGANGDVGAIFALGQRRADANNQFVLPPRRRRAALTFEIRDQRRRRRQ